jgi:hypothetical protein
VRRACLVLLIASLASVACGTTSPQRVQRRIFNIVVPSQAAVGDSIRIAFLDDTGPCDTGPRVDTQLANDTLRIAVSSIPRDGSCMTAFPGVLVTGQPFVYYALPPHPRDLTVVFAEPDGGDSVRTVTVR